MMLCRDFGLRATKELSKLLQVLQQLLHSFRAGVLGFARVAEPKRQIVRPQSHLRAGAGSVDLQLPRSGANPSASSIRYKVQQLHNLGGCLES